jgi:hypothetical protein
MISDSFDERTIANMEVALDRACESLPHGGDHTARGHTPAPHVGAIQHSAD